MLAHVAASRVGRWPLERRCRAESASEQWPPGKQQVVLKTRDLVRCIEVEVNGQVHIPSICSNLRFASGDMPSVANELPLPLPLLWPLEVDGVVVAAAGGSFGLLGCDLPVRACLADGCLRAAVTTAA